MKQFQDKNEEFNYYVLKSKWYEENGDLINYKKFLNKASVVQRELDDKKSKSR